MSLCTYGLLACSAFPAQPCELKLLHAAIKGGKVTKAGGPCVGSPALDQTQGSSTLQAVCRIYHGQHLHGTALLQARRGQPRIASLLDVSLALGMAPRVQLHADCCWQHDH
jgi:hypothetical protein